MVTKIIDILQSNNISTNNEFIKLARGKYKNPTTFKELLKKAFRKFKNIE